MARHGYHSHYQVEKTAIDWAGSLGYVYPPQAGPVNWERGMDYGIPVHAMADCMYGCRFMRNNGGRTREAITDVVRRFAYGSFGGLEVLVTKQTADGEIHESIMPYSPTGRIGTSVIADGIRNRGRAAARCVALGLAKPAESDIE